MQKKIQMTKKKIFFIVGLILVAIIITTLLYNPKSPGSKEAGTSAIKQSVEVSLNVYELEGGWAYKVLINNTTFIAQELIPGIPNNKKFVSKTDAEKCGNLVIRKIKAHQLPSISKSELDSLKIHYETD